MKRMLLVFICVSSVYAMEQSGDELHIPMPLTPHNSPNKAPKLPRRKPSAKSINALTETTEQAVPAYVVPSVETISTDTNVQKKIHDFLNSIEKSDVQSVENLLQQLKSEASVDQALLAARIKPLAQAVHQKAAYVKDIPNNTNKKLIGVGSVMIGLSVYQFGINIYNSVTNTTETTQQGLTAGNYPSAAMWLFGGGYYLYNGLTNQTPDVTLMNAMSIYQLLQKEYPTI